MTLKGLTRAYQLFLVIITPKSLLKRKTFFVKFNLILYFKPFSKLEIQIIS